MLCLQVCRAHISSMVEALLLGKVVNCVQIIDGWFSSFTVASPKLDCCMLADTRSFSLACDIDILSKIIPYLMQKDHPKMSTFHVIWVALTHILYVQNSPFAQHWNIGNIFWLWYFFSGLMCVISVYRKIKVYPNYYKTD